MRVAIAGGHGQIALRLARILSERGDQVVALIRNPDQADDVGQAGAEPAVVDLEHASEEEVSQAIAGSDAVVFAAGAGPGSGSERKETMDYGGAVKLIAAAKLAGVAVRDREQHGGECRRARRRHLQRVPAREGAGRRRGPRERARRHRRPPRRAHQRPGTGRVNLGESVPGGRVTRDDVAAVLAAVLDSPHTIGRTLDLVGGDTPIAEAVKAI